MPLKRPRLALAVLCLSSFTINLATMIVNVSLPTLTRELSASTDDLLWIVDVFNLVFAAFVLAAGSLSDRFGRKGALMTGLVTYLAGSLGSAWSGSAGALIGWRALAGLGAAVIFPTTLSIISNLFRDRTQRARAIGLWGATSGVAVAAGPIVGGALLKSYWWGSAFLVCAVIAAIALALTAFTVPTSRDPSAPRLDIGGLVLSTATLGLVVYTIINAPDRGWAGVATLGGFAGSAVLGAAFVVLERRVAQPMLDVSLFTNLRFTAASGAVTITSFALFGFIFLIAQYFQFVLHYGVLEAGLRQIPVALAVAISSILGTRLAVRIGTKTVVTAGLLLMALGYLWVSRVDEHTAYVTIALQMLVVGAGIGLTSAPATEAIMGVVPPARAGVGSAVNDATRELGGTLGVAVVGSVALSVYRDRLAGGGLDAGLVSRAQQSLGAAAATARAAAQPALLRLAEDGFLSGLAIGCYVAGGVTLVGAVLTLLWLPVHPAPSAEPQDASPTMVPA
ncbi:MFS transporter [Dactylosporangium matsuzakiense]|uniref:MFS transporter n=1 Tax=Dactylosporangium matsuzakiense TaxID=53360 RepID=A0A9W6NT55_9ACTN|nr:MFS transporter [Dactylosporangium matsuzakiense]GLL08339.1 MFS transporter [Dactylosporangium matsuzakiense]